MSVTIVQIQHCINGLAAHKFITIQFNPLTTTLLAIFVIVSGIAMRLIPFYYRNHPMLRYNF
jgi:hypothetical protein